MARIVLSAAALALLALLSLVHAQLQINRNTDDCINPALTINDWRIWPNSNYMISGTSVTRDNAGNYVVRGRKRQSLAATRVPVSLLRPEFALPFSLTIWRLICADNQ